MAGAFVNGDKVNGFRSCVLANYTGVSLQRDLSCWQKYSDGAWGSLLTTTIT